jgi:hypothetical protein
MDVRNIQNIQNIKNNKNIKSYNCFICNNIFNNNEWYKCVICNIYLHKKCYLMNVYTFFIFCPNCYCVGSIGQCL